MYWSGWRLGGFVADWFIVGRQHLIVIVDSFNFDRTFIAWVGVDRFGGVSSRLNGKTKQICLRSNGPEMIGHRHSCLDWRKAAQRA